VTDLWTSLGIRQCCLLPDTSERAPPLLTMHGGARSLHCKQRSLQFAQSTRGNVNQLNRNNRK